MARVSRRRFLGSFGAAGAGLALTTGTIGFGHVAGDVLATPAIVPFEGAHQSGIDTPSQERLFIAAFDITTNRLDDVREMLKSWTDAARLMCAGEPAGSVDGSPYLPPSDTGEALGLTAANLTLTIGFGPTFFERDGQDRIALAWRRPDRMR